MRISSLARAAAAALAAAAVPLPAAAVAPAAAEPPTTVDDLLAYAEVHSPLNLIARARLLRGQAAIDAAAPTLQGNPQLTSQVGTRSGSGGGAEFELALSQPFEVSGQQGLRRSAAQQVAAVARSSADQTAWEVHRAVHNGWNEVLAAQLQVGLAKAAVASAEATAALWGKRTKAGEESPLTALVGQVEVAQARQGLLQAEAALAQASLTLQENAGWPADRPLAVRGELPALKPAPGLLELQRRAVQGSPSLRSALAVVAQAQAALRLEDRSAAPVPSFGVRYAQEAGGAAAAHVVQATVGLPLPIWNANRTERLRARADATVAQVERQTAERVLAFQVAKAHAAVQAAHERAQSAQSLLGASFEQQLQLLERAHQLGEVDALQVGQARSRLWQARQQAVSAHLDYARSLADLEAILGQDVWPAKAGAQ